ACFRATPIARPMPRVPPVTTASRAMFRPPYRVLFVRSALDAERDAHAAADAERGQPLVQVALLHLVQQRDEHAGAGRPDRVADGDGAAIDVDLGGVPSEVLVDGAGLGGE